MSEYTSSSDNESEESKKSGNGLSLNEVNDMIKEYEREEKRERKKRIDRDNNIGEVVIDEETLKSIVLSQAQMKKLKPKKPRSEKQIESAKRLLDVRKKQREEEKAENERQAGLRLKVAAKRERKTKAKLPPVDESELIDSDDDGEKKPKSKFQASKPKLDDDDEVEKKVNKLNQINSILTSNPYYAQILKSRGIKF
jgi:hypothetical protein